VHLLNSKVASASRVGSTIRSRFAWCRCPSACGHRAREAPWRSASPSILRRLCGWRARALRGIFATCRHQCVFRRSTI